MKNPNQIRRNRKLAKPIAQGKSVPLLQDSKRTSIIAENPRDLREFWYRNLPHLKWFDPAKETLVVVILNTRYRVVGYSVVGIGSLNECIAHPREVFRPSIVHAGYAVVVMHNHPGGDPSPSEQDLRLTERLQAAADILQIKFLDHLIIGAAKKYFSFKEHGVFPFGDAKRMDSAKKKAKSDQIDLQDAQDLLENEIIKTYALLEVMAVLRKPINDDFIPLDMITIDGLHRLAKEQGADLLNSFEAMSTQPGEKLSKSNDQ